MSENKTIYYRLFLTNPALSFLKNVAFFIMIHDSKTIMQTSFPVPLEYICKQIQTENKIWIPLQFKNAKYIFFREINDANKPIFLKSLIFRQIEDNQMRMIEKREVFEYFVKLISKQMKNFTLTCKNYWILYFFSRKVDFADFTYFLIKGVRVCTVWKWGNFDLTVSNKESVELFVWVFLIQ